MQDLRLIPSSQVCFPNQAWHCLRNTVLFSANDPAFFLLGVEGADKRLLAWHPKGGAVDFSANPDAVVPVLVLRTAAAPLDSFLLYIQSTFQTALPLEVEWVYVLKTLQEIFHYDLASQGIPEPLARALTACGLEAHLNALANRARFLFLDFAEMKFLFDKKWDPTAFELLETLDAPVRAAFLSAISNKTISSGNAKEALQSTLYLAKKFGTATALKLLGATYKSAEDFQTALFHTAQPELARLSQTRIERLRALSAPPRTSVFGDPSFESDQIKISHTPKNMGDFESFKTWVSDPKTAEKLRQLLDIYL